MAEARAQTERIHRVDAAVRAGLIASTGFQAGGVGYLFGSELTYRLGSALRTGIYGEWAGAAALSGDTRFYYDAHFEAFRFGVRGQWHLQSQRIVDPWIGASFGPFVTTDTALMNWVVDGESGANVVAGRWGFDIGFEAGVDFRIGGGPFFIGPLVFIVVPFGAVRQPEGLPTALTKSKAVGVYHNYIPLPLLRLGMTI